MHKDATGRPIMRGAYVAYAVGKGSGATGIKFGAVVKLKSNEVERHQYNPSTRGYDTVKETRYTIGIVSAENHCTRDAQGQLVWKWVVQGKSAEDRPARIQSIERLDRVIVLEGHQMQPEAKEVLEKELHERGDI